MMCHSSGKLGVFGKLEPNETEQKYEMEPAQSGARARHMDDDEARYLKDQFNKLASWRMSGLHLVLSQYGPMLAVIAICISILPIAWRGAPLDASNHDSLTSPSSLMVP
jgi:hypothetical protein